MVGPRNIIYKTAIHELPVISLGCRVVSKYFLRHQISQQGLSAYVHAIGY